MQYFIWSIIRKCSKKVAAAAAGQRAPVRRGMVIGPQAHHTALPGRAVAATLRRPSTCVVMRINFLGVLCGGVCWKNYTENWKCCWLSILFKGESDVVLPQVGSEYGDYFRCLNLAVQ
jgi:hypothetical protein